MRLRHPCSAHHGPSGRSRDEVPLNIFFAFEANMPKIEPSVQDREKRRFREMPNRNGAIYNRLRGTKREKKDARRHFGHSRLRPLGLFSSDFSRTTQTRFGGPSGQSQEPTTTNRFCRALLSLGNNQVFRLPTKFSVDNQNCKISVCSTIIIIKKQQHSITSCSRRRVSPRWVDACGEGFFPTRGGSFF